MIHTFFGTKIKQTQVFNTDGARMPATVISATPCWITQVKIMDKDMYTAVQLGFGTKRISAKPQKGHLKKAGLDKAPRFFREIRVDEKETADNKIKAGDSISVDQVFQAGDVVTVSATSKGKGFTGVMKRWGFAGGPATHGQSDRARAPGSIGGTTTPGRVYKGKKMAGRSGGDLITVKNLHVVSVDKEKNEMVVSGLVPGPKKGLIRIIRTKRVEKPKQEKQEEPKEEVKTEVQSKEPESKKE